jgi:phosphoribosylformylglycinamidine (FGAM) synthase PurS component
MATLRRRRRALAAAAVIGLVAGVVYVFVEPPPLSSTTLVLLPTPALAESSSSDVETQVRIALSATILERAGQAVEPKLSARKVEKRVDVSAPTNQLLQIKATSTKAAEAQTLSQAAADAYVGYVSDTAREVTQAALADLNVRKDDLEKQILNLRDEIVSVQLTRTPPRAGKKPDCSRASGKSKPTCHCSSTRSRTRLPLVRRWEGRPRGPRSFRRQPKQPGRRL